MELAETHKNFHLLRYSDLVADSLQCVEALFESTGMPMTRQTREFLADCHTRHDQNPYSVFKTKTVVDDWKVELNPSIAETIIGDTKAAGLGYFLV